MTTSGATVPVTAGGTVTVSNNNTDGDRGLVSTLMLNQSMPSDSGTYICEAMNEVTAYNSTATLIVYGKICYFITYKLS